MTWSLKYEIEGTAMHYHQFIVVAVRFYSIILEATVFMNYSISQSMDRSKSSPEDITLYNITMIAYYSGV